MGLLLRQVGAREARAALLGQAGRALSFKDLAKGISRTALPWTARGPDDQPVGPASAPCDLAK